MSERHDAYYRLVERRHLLPPARPDGITERDWAITVASYRDRRRQTDIAREHGITPPRVRQILMKCARVILSEATP